MALDTLPDDGINVKTREEMRQFWLRCVRIRNPAASTAEDTQPWVDASVMSDVLAPMSMNARTIGRSIPLSEVSGSRLDQRLIEYGLSPRFPETGSQGSVTIDASSNGTTIPAGTELADSDQGLKFKCSLSGTYQDGSTVPIAALDTGTQTNLKPGTVMIWRQGISGLFATCTVTEQTDGSGLSGGRAEESDDEVRERISSALANPAAAGNDSEYQKLIENSRGHGVSVQKAFTYNTINGPGTIGCAFTMKPASIGASRRPNNTQMATVQAFVVGQLPNDDSYLPVTILPQATDVSFEIDWADGAAGWADPSPWPPRLEIGQGAVVVASATDALNFILKRDDNDYSTAVNPVAGNSIGFFNPANGGTFSRKTLLSVTGSGPWTCVADASNGASDTTYIPLAPFQRACPWSDSLVDLTAPVASYFGTLGPGEQKATFFDPGLRQKRSPAPPKKWPYAISSKIETDILALPSVSDVRTKEGLGAIPVVGIPGAISYMLELRYISAFPLN